MVCDSRVLSTYYISDLALRRYTLLHEIIEIRSIDLISSKRKRLIKLAVVRGVLLA